MRVHVRVSTCQHAYVRIRKLLCIFVYVRVSFYMPVRACVCACVRAYERASMRVCVQLRHNDTHAGGQNYVAI